MENIKNQKQNAKKFFLILIVIISILIFILGYLSLFNLNSPGDQDFIKVGAILPMTGSAAFWGEAMKEGMEMALTDLNREKINLKIIYEDSQADAKLGLSAYNKLKDIDKVDVVVSLSTRVSIPLIPLATEDKTPLIMTVVSGKGLADESRYSIRYYPDETGYAIPHLNKIIKSEYQKIALLYLNDDYGSSVAEVIKADLNNKGIEITSEEKFSLGQTDFRTSLIKIKDKKPDAVMFVGAVPAELVSVLSQFRELKIDAKFFECNSLLTMSSVQKAVGENSEGVYTLAFPFTIGMTGQDFMQKYKLKYGKRPFYGPAFGYDIIMFIDSVSKGGSIRGEQFISNMEHLEEINTLNGLVKVKSNGEINIPMYSRQIQNGQLVEW